MVNFFSTKILTKIIFSLVILGSTFAVHLFIKKTLSLFFAKLKKLGKSKLTNKGKTLNSISQNVIDVLIFSLAILIIISQWGVNITPILTGAGIFGLAISFGAQSLVKDIIAGFFFLVEDQFNVGDHVKIGLLEGDVYKLTLRLTILKDSEGKKIYIPNSQIKTLTRFPEKKNGN